MTYNLRRLALFLLHYYFTCAAYLSPIKMTPKGYIVYIGPGGMNDFKEGSSTNLVLLPNSSWAGLETLRQLTGKDNLRLRRKLVNLGYYWAEQF